MDDATKYAICEEIAVRNCVNWLRDLREMTKKPFEEQLNEILQRMASEVEEYMKADCSKEVAIALMAHQWERKLEIASLYPTGEDGKIQGTWLFFWILNEFYDYSNQVFEEPGIDDGKGGEEKHGIDIPE